MHPSSCFRGLALSLVLLFVLLAPAALHAQCRPDSSFPITSIADVYAKRHSNGTYTLWFVHQMSHEVLCGTTDCDGNPDEYVWRSGSGGNSNVSSVSPIDSCGESMTFTPSNPSSSATAVMRIKFAENYYASFPLTYYPRKKNFDVIVDPSQVFYCECIFQLNCSSTTGACGATATLLGSPTNCSIC
ncbi:MAG: hypothetical protein ABUT39_09305 [Acidobacteriota bacterium]